MPKMTESYKAAVALPLTDDYKEVIPTKVFEICTRCAAVRDYSRAAFSKAVREALSERSSLVSLIRSGFDAGQIPGAPDGSGVDDSKLHKLMTLLLNAKLLGGLVRINPKFIAREGFFQLLTGSVDAVVKENDNLILIRLSRAKKAATDETGVLMYLLLGYMNYPTENSITYRKIHILQGGGREENFVLDKSVLTEDPLVTIKKLLSSMVQTQRDKGENCADCIHVSYCTVLKHQLEEEVNNAD